MDVYSNFIHNFQNLQTAKMFFSRWMDKLVHPDNEMLFNDKKKWTIKPWKDMDEPLNALLLSERSQSEMATYYIIPTKWHFGQGKTMDKW